MDIGIDKITAFASSDNFIDVFAIDGRGVYTYPNPTSREVHFNLPPGQYVTDNELTELEFPLIYECPELPYPIIYRKMKHMRFTIAPNPHFCSIDFNKDPDYADVVIDPEVADNDIPFFEYILFHEQGHFYYGGAPTPGTKRYYQIENYCDIFAAKEMMKFGFNPSQCYYACELSLTEREGAKWRKWKLGQWLGKVKVIDRNKTEDMEHFDVLKDKIWVSKIKQQCFITDNRTGAMSPIGIVNPGDYIGDMLGKVKRPNDDSYVFEFKAPDNEAGLNQFNHGHNPFFLICESDEISYEMLKLDPLSKAGLKGKEKLEELGKMITQMLLVALTVYIIYEVVAKNDFK